MLLEQATPSNVSRAIKEINAFEWEGDFKPMARQALKHLVEKRLDEEMAQYIGLSRYEHGADRVDYRNGHYTRHLLTEMGNLELLVPRSRKGGFPTKLLERLRPKVPFGGSGVVSLLLFGTIHPKGRFGAGSYCRGAGLGHNDFQDCPGSG